MYLPTVGFVIDFSALCGTVFAWVTDMSAGLSQKEKPSISSYTQPNTIKHPHKIPVAHAHTHTVNQTHIVHGRNNTKSDGKSVITKISCV